MIPFYENVIDIFMLFFSPYLKPPEVTIKSISESSEMEEGHHRKHLEIYLLLHNIYLCRKMTESKSKNASSYYFIIYRKGMNSSYNQCIKDLFVQPLLSSGFILFYCKIL